MGDSGAGNWDGAGGIRVERMVVGMAGGVGMGMRV